MPRHRVAPRTTAMIPFVRCPRQAITVRDPLPEHGISPILIVTVQKTFAVPLTAFLRFNYPASRSTVDLTQMAALVICSTALGLNFRPSGFASDIEVVQVAVCVYK